MNVLVTGATGFIGRRVVQHLVARGHFVRCLVRGTSDLRPLQYQPVELWRGDITDSKSLSGAFEGTYALIHLVGIIKERPPGITFQRIHIEGTQHLLEAAKTAGTGHCIYLSALGASPDRSYPYLMSKWLAEELVRQSGTPWTILRSSIVYGEGDEFMTRLAAQVRRPPAGDRTLAPFMPIIGSGKTRFQPIWVEDLAECIVRTLGDSSFQGRTIAVGGPQQFTYEELVDLVMATLPLRRPKIHVPVALMRPAIALMPLVYKDPPITAAQLKMLELDSVTEPDAVQQAFGFQPARLEEKIEYLKAES